MQIKVVKTVDVLTPSLRANLAKATNPRKALESMGLVCVSLAQRSFTEASARPTTWPPLSPKTIKEKAKLGYGSTPLVREGQLARTPRIVSVTDKNVVVGSDRADAKYHQLGTKTIPARPFFPFDPETGKPTDKARRLILAAAKRTLSIEK
jgi:phage gpG-like protein